LQYLNMNDIARSKNNEAGLDLNLFFSSSSSLRIRFFYTPASDLLRYWIATGSLLFGGLPNKL